MEEALILVLATLRFKETINATTIKHVVYYYSLSTLERSFEKIPIALMTIISSIVPPESLPPTLPEYLKKLHLYIDPPIMEELRTRERELGFAYNDFKKPFSKSNNFLNRIVTGVSALMPLIQIFICVKARTSMPRETALSKSCALSVQLLESPGSHPKLLT